MLPRTLEPEVMDSPSEAQEYDAMDHREVNRRFVDDLLDRLAPRAGGLRAIDLGTGTAQIPIELCGRCESVHVTAVDAAPSMLVLADQNIRQSGLSGRVETRLDDAKQLDPSGRFDIVMSNSIIHHLADPRPVIELAIGLLDAGGLLFFRDLMRPASDAELAALVRQHAAGCTEHQRRLFSDSLHAALTVAEMQQLVAAAGADPQGVVATSDRHWTWVHEADD
ncbi:MAG: methyltransferase domain-containing protein [Planctomycetales bacterium]|nr:methyltransferase domain-containing protein [Planctomycetales bacterium]